MWRGPKKALHDFVCGAIDIEVKSSLRTTETIIEVNDLKQLDPPDGGLALPVLLPPERDSWARDLGPRDHRTHTLSRSRFGAALLVC